MLRRFAIAFLGFTLALASIQASANSEKKKEGKPAAPNSTYLALDPSFVVNFGSPGGKLRYLRADIVLRLLDGPAEEAVTLHMPQVRDALIMLLSQQSEQAVATAEGKETVRQAALEVVRRVIKAQPPAEEGEEKKKEKTEEEAKLEKERASNGGVTDLLFNNFVIQK